MADAPVNSLRHDLKPELAKKFSPTAASHAGYAHRDPADRATLSGKDLQLEEGRLQGAEDMLLKVRPYIKYFHPRAISTTWPMAKSAWRSLERRFSDRGHARDDAKNGVEINYRIPKEGTLLWIDNLAIPADAPHPENAMKFINFLIATRYRGRRSNFVNYATPNKAAAPLVNADLRRTRMSFRLTM